MTHDKNITEQAHHLSQNAAFKSIIPTQKGLSIELQGNAFINIGSEHYNAHKSLEQFWNIYRKGGELYGEMPTIGEYNRALYESLQYAGISNMEVAKVVV